MFDVFFHLVWFNVYRLSGRQIVSLPIAVYRERERRGRGEWEVKKGRELGGSEMVRIFWTA